jgi:hypothetical protein
MGTGGNTGVMSSYQTMRTFLQQQPQFIDVYFASQNNAATHYYLGTEDPNPRGEKHLNEAGNAVVAGDIYAALQSLLLKQ